MPAALRMELFPSNLDTFIHFWTTVFGFTLATRYQAYCAVRRDPILFGALQADRLTQHARWAPASGENHSPQTLYAHRAPPAGVEIVIEVDDIDAEYARVAPLVEIRDEDKIGDREWGMRDFRVYDPFGHDVRFTGRVPDESRNA